MSQGIRGLGAWGCPRLGDGTAHSGRWHWGTGCPWCPCSGTVIHPRGRSQAPVKVTARWVTVTGPRRGWGGRGVPTAHETPGDPWSVLGRIPAWGRIGLGDPRPTQDVWGPGGATAGVCHWGMAVGDTRDPPLPGRVLESCRPRPRWHRLVGGRSRGALPGLGSGQGHGDTGSRESAGAARASSPLPSLSLSPSLSPPSVSLSPISVITPVPIPRGCASHALGIPCEPWGLGVAAAGGAGGGGAQAPGSAAPRAPPRPGVPAGPFRALPVPPPGSGDGWSRGGPGGGGRRGGLGGSRPAPSAARGAGGTRGPPERGHGPRAARQRRPPRRGAAGAGPPGRPGVQPGGTGGTAGAGVLTGRENGTAVCSAAHGLGVPGASPRQHGGNGAGGGGHRGSWRAARGAPRGSEDSGEGPPAGGTASRCPLTVCGVPGVSPWRGGGMEHGGRAGGLWGHQGVLRGTKGF